MEPIKIWFPQDVLNILSLFSIKSCAPSSILYKYEAFNSTQESNKNNRAEASFDTTSYHSMPRAKYYFQISVSEKRPPTNIDFHLIKQPIVYFQSLMKSLFCFFIPLYRYLHMCWINTIMFLPGEFAVHQIIGDFIDISCTSITLLSREWFVKWL